MHGITSPLTKATALQPNTGLNVPVAYPPALATASRALAVMTSHGVPTRTTTTSSLFREHPCTLSPIHPCTTLADPHRRVRRRGSPHHLQQTSHCLHKPRGSVACQKLPSPSRPERCTCVPPQPPRADLPTVDCVRLAPSAVTTSSAACRASSHRTTSTRSSAPLRA